MSFPGYALACVDQIMASGVHGRRLCLLASTQIRIFRLTNFAQHGMSTACIYGFLNSESTAFFPSYIPHLMTCCIVMFHIGMKRYLGIIRPSNFL